LTEIASLTVAVAGLIVALVALAAAVWYARAPHRVAVRDLTKPKPLRFFVNGSEVRNLLYISVQGSKDVVHVPFDLWVTNENETSVEDLMLTIEIPELLYGSNLDRMGDGAMRIHRVERVTDLIDGTILTRLMYRLPLVNPGTFQIRDQIFLPGVTHMSATFDATSKDGVAFKVHSRLAFCWTVRIQSTAKNLVGDEIALSIRTYAPTDKEVARLANWDRPAILREFQAHAASPDFEMPEDVVIHSIRKTQVAERGPKSQRLLRAREADIDRYPGIWVKDLGAFPLVRGPEPSVWQLLKAQRAGALKEAATKQPSETASAQRPGS
jgi:hypothetical protein